MNTRIPRRFLAAAAAMAMACFAVPANADAMLVSVTGAIQGPFKGDGTLKGATGKSRLDGFEYALSSPRDATTGQPIGKVQHKPVVFEKRAGASTPQWLAALAGNEALTVIVEFHGVSASGTLVIYQTVKLDNARVVTFELGAATDRPDQEKISLVYQKLELIREGLKFSSTWGL